MEDNLSNYAVGFDPYNNDAMNYGAMLGALEVIAKDELTMSGEIARKVLAGIRKPNVDAVKVFNKEDRDEMWKKFESEPIQIYRSDTLKPVRDKLDELIQTPVLYKSDFDIMVLERGLRYRAEGQLHLCQLLLGLPLSTFPLTKTDEQNNNSGR